MRDLPKLMPATGWKLKGAVGNCVSEIGGTPSYWVSFAKAYLPRVRAAGVFGDAEVDAWRQHQEQAIADGSFFAHCIYYTFTAEASE